MRAGIWLLFALVFLGLAYYHLQASKQNIPTFELKPRPYAGSATMHFGGVDIDQPIKDFVVEFNSYVRSQNASASSSNRVSCAGYVGAALTAIASFFFEVFPKQDRQQGIPANDQNSRPTASPHPIDVDRLGSEDDEDKNSGPLKADEGT